MKFLNLIFNSEYISKGIQLTIAGDISTIRWKYQRYWLNITLYWAVVIKIILEKKLLLYISLKYYTIFVFLTVNTFIL